MLRILFELLDLFVFDLIIYCCLFVGFVFWIIYLRIAICGGGIEIG